MKTAPMYLLLVLPLCMAFGCTEETPSETPVAVALQDEALSHGLQADTLLLTETIDAEDIRVNDYLKDRLQPIRDNFKRINTVENWSHIHRQHIFESTEGGEVRFYYLDGRLEKIVQHYFGEMGQTLREYYLQDGQLSFVLEKRQEYSSPFYMDSTAISQSIDSEMSGPEPSTVIEERSYFEYGQLIHQLNNQDCGAPMAHDYLREEQQRLMAEFEKLIRLSTQ